MQSDCAIAWYGPEDVLFLLPGWSVLYSGYTQVLSVRCKRASCSLAPDIPCTRVNFGNALCHPHVSPDLFINILQLQTKHMVVAIVSQ